MKNAKHPHHTMLPVHLQKMLMFAAASGRAEVVDRAIKNVYETMPHKFHTVTLVRDWRYPMPCVGPFPGGAARST